jgi:NADPH:quinone reductase-like Zn-dependent oxidoreductase
MIPTTPIKSMDDVEMEMKMKAIVYDRYGGPEVLELRDIERPVPGADEVLVRVHAASLNALDWHFTTGTPYFMRLMVGLRRPKRHTPGVDVAGTVEAVGRDVTTFELGDEVFGSGVGSCAEFVVAAENRLAPKPQNMTFEQAAAVPVAAITALQGLREYGKVEPGQKVLINGAAGGVGTYAVQIAKALGAEVTAVCSTHNVDTVRSIGADHVVDYTTDDFVARGGRYDVMLDNVGNRSPAECRRVLADDGMCVVISGPKRNRLLGPVTHVVRTLTYFKFFRQDAVMFTAEETPERLLALCELLESGAVIPVIERTYTLDETAEALSYIGSGHARGKLAKK